jgi:AraC-like DNA-binding protein
MLPITSTLESSWLNRYRLFESSDLDDTRERVSRVLQPHRLRPGRLRHGLHAYVNCASFGNVSFGSIGYASTMSVDAGEVDDYYLLILAPKGYGDVTVGAQRMIVGQSQGVLVGPRTHFSGTFSDHSEQYFLRINRDALLAHSGHAQLRFASAIDLSNRALAPLLVQLAALAGSPETVQLAQRDSRVAVELERLIVTLLLAGQPNDALPPGREWVSVPRALRRAETYIAEHALEPLRVSDIADAAGVPVRTLLHNFKVFRETSPMQRVRDVRMEHSHERLMRAGESERVADVALACGFVNLGRFAKAYRERFGESPSDTLRKARAQHG